MKPSMLGLVIASGAFGASTIYLATQLRDERARADEVLEQSRALSARIAELENAREELVAMRLSGEPENEGTAGEGLGKPAALVSTGTLADSSERPGAEAPGWRADRSGPPPERTEAMRKMMRTQLRANFKRLHGDIGERLGLGQEDANKLIDLMIEQQMAMADRGRQERGSNLTPEQRAAGLAAQNEKNLTEVSALIGSDKIEAYRAYQETIPARQEVDGLSRQLEANDLVLSKDQRERMVAALADERKRVPQPKLSESVSREEYSQALTAWQDDYNQRTATRASSILNSDQQAAYNEYQQWNKEMRQQFESRRAAREGSRQ
jgi:hypothetical protein